MWRFDFCGLFFKLRLSFNENILLFALFRNKGNGSVEKFTLFSEIFLLKKFSFFAIATLSRLKVASRLKLSFLCFLLFPLGISANNCAYPSDRFATKQAKKKLQR